MDELFEVVTGKIKFAELTLENMAGVPEVEIKYYWEGGETVAFSSDWHEMFTPKIKVGDEFNVGPFALLAVAWHGKYKSWLECRKIDSVEG